MPTSTYTPFSAAIFDQEFRSKRNFPRLAFFGFSPFFLLLPLSVPPIRIPKSCWTKVDRVDHDPLDLATSFTFFSPPLDLYIYTSFLSLWATSSWHGNSVPMQTNKPWHPSWLLEMLFFFYCYNIFDFFHTYREDTLFLFDVSHLSGVIYNWELWIWRDTPQGGLTKHSGFLFSVFDMYSIRGVDPTVFGTLDFWDNLSLFIFWDDFGIGFLWFFGGFLCIDFFSHWGKPRYSLTIWYLGLRPQLNIYTYHALYTNFKQTCYLNITIVIVRVCMVQFTFVVILGMGHCQSMPYSIYFSWNLPKL